MSRLDANRRTSAPLSPMPAVEPRLDEYVERSFEEREARFHELIESLGQALGDEDMVDVYSQWLSLRFLVSELRFAARKERDERWRTFGMLHDAIAFTPIDRLDPSMIDVVARAFSLAGQDHVDSDDVYRMLRDGGLDLVPEMKPRHAR